MNHKMFDRYQTSSKNQAFCSNYSSILKDNIFQYRALKQNCPNYQRKDPITHDGLVKEQDEPFRPSKNNSSNNYADNITRPTSQEKFSKKRIPIYHNLLKENNIIEWKPSVKQFQKNDFKKLTDFKLATEEMQAQKISRKASFTPHTFNPILQNGETPDSNLQSSRVSQQSSRVSFSNTNQSSRVSQSMSGTLNGQSLQSSEQLNQKIYGIKDSKKCDYSNRSYSRSKIEISFDQNSKCQDPLNKQKKKFDQKDNMKSILCHESETLNSNISQSRSQIGILFDQNSKCQDPLNKQKKQFDYKDNMKSILCRESETLKNHKLKENTVKVTTASITSLLNEKLIKKQQIKK